MKFKWHVVAASLSLGLVLALFQNCGLATRQVQITRDFATPGETVQMKAADVMTYGTMKGHLDLSDVFSAGSEVTMELLSSAANELAEVQLRNRSVNLLSFPFSAEGKCPSPESFDPSNTSSSPVSMGSGYILKDASSNKFAYVLFAGFLGSELENGAFNLIQLSLKTILPKPGATFEMFLKDLCEEP